MPTLLSAMTRSILDLARRERLPLATLDDRLRNAAAREGVALLRLPFKLPPQLFPMAFKIRACPTANFMT